MLHASTEPKVRGSRGHSQTPESQRWMGFPALGLAAVDAIACARQRPRRHDSGNRRDLDADPVSDLVTTAAAAAPQERPVVAPIFWRFLARRGEMRRTERSHVGMTTFRTTSWPSRFSETSACQRGLCPSGNVQRKNLSPGFLHQQSARQSQVIAPRRSCAWATRATAMYSAPRTGRPRLIMRQE